MIITATLQHVLAMISSVILVPILINTAVGKEMIPIGVALITSGIGTLLYLFCTRGKIPIYLGNSLAFVTPMILAAEMAGKAGVFTGVIAVGLVYVICAIMIKLGGKKWIDILLPPVVVGPMIMIIGLNLLSTTIAKIGMAEGAMDIKLIIIGVITLGTTILLQIKGKGIWKTASFFIGIIVGVIIAIILQQIPFPKIDDWFQIPDFTLPFYDYIPNTITILTMIPITLVTIAEHIGNHATMGIILDKNVLKEPGLDRTLFSNGLSIIISGVLGGPVNTPYGQNISLIGMTKITSVWTIVFTALVAIVLGFFSKFTNFINCMPQAIFGGISVLLYGFIIMNGIKIIQQAKIDLEQQQNSIIIGTILVLGIGGAILYVHIHQVSFTLSSLAVAAISGVILNLLFRKRKEQ